MIRRLPLLFALPGCITTFEDWVDARNEVLCELFVTCFDTRGDHEACVDDLATFDDPSCPEFSPRAARACVDDMSRQASDCVTRDIRRWQIPATCADVCPQQKPSDGTVLAPPPPRSRRMP